MRPTRKTILKRIQIAYNDVHRKYENRKKYPKWLCYKMSMEILKHPAMFTKGWECRLVTGTFMGYAHSWIWLGDGSIVDATITQFLPQADPLTILTATDKLYRKYDADHFEYIKHDGYALADYER